MPINKILIVGNGSMGQRRAKILKELTTAKLTTYDPASGDITEGVVDVTEYDAVFVCSPPVNHSAWVFDAVEKQVPVFVEKPFCLPGEITGLKQRVELAKKPVMLGHNLLWHKGFLEFKERVAELGPLLRYGAVYGNKLENWHRENKDSYSKHRAQGGGVLLDCLQDIDLALEVTGGLEPKASHQRVGPPHTVDSEYIVTILAYRPDGVVATFAFDYVGEERQRAHVAMGQANLVSWYEDRGPELDQSYVDETEAFLKWVETGRKPKGIPDPFRALEFVRKIYAL